MTDSLQQTIRDTLTIVADSTVMTPDAEAMADLTRRLEPVERAGGRARSRPFSVAATLVLLAGVATWSTLRSNDVELVIADNDPAIQFGTPIEIDLGRSVNVKLPMAIAGDALIGSLDAPSLNSSQIRLARVDSPTATPEEILSSPTGGSVTAIEAAGDTILAVANQHVTSQLPLVFISSDGGDTWSEAELPAPPNVPLSDAFVSDAAIGTDGFVVLGPYGVWVSATGSEWEFIEVIDGDSDVPMWMWDQLAEVTWTGDDFVLAGGIVDPEIPDAADHDIAFWRSVDGRSWGEPDIVQVDPSIRTSDGVEHIVSDGAGRVLSLTPTQQWQDGRQNGEDRGTLVAVSSSDGEFAAEHLADWILYDAFAFDNGFLTAGVREDQRSEPRFLFTVDGRSWTDVGPAPGVSSIGHSWGDHIVMNGAQVEGGNPNLTWALAIGEAGVPLPTPSTLPGSENVATTQPAPTTTSTGPTTTGSFGTTTDGSSQSAADAARDFVVPAVAALTLDERLREQTRITTDEGSWIISRLSREIEQASNDTGCGLGDPNGVYLVDIICTYEYAEVLLLNGQDQITRAFPMPGAPPSWIEITDEAIYSGRFGDGGLPYSTLARIDRSTYEIDVIVFPTGIEDPSTSEWLPSWIIAEDTLLPQLSTLVESVNTRAFDQALADDLIDAAKP